MEAHCIALELKYQNQALKSGQHGQILNETNNKAKIKKEIDVLETINIELEHSVAKLRNENETLKKHYKDFSYSGKVFAIAALKNDLRKLKGNSIDTKFAKTSVLEKSVLQSLRNQSVKPTGRIFKSVGLRWIPTGKLFDSCTSKVHQSLFRQVNQVVSKSSAVTATDASVKRQQQPDSTSSTSTLATTVTADGNFDL
ncbi:hypothetical protein Tco_1568689 [Tanacetum coccineum]